MSSWISSVHPNICTAQCPGTVQCPQGQFARLCRDAVTLGIRSKRVIQYRRERISILSKTQADAISASVLELAHKDKAVPKVWIPYHFRCRELYALPPATRWAVIQQGQQETHRSWVTLGQVVVFLILAYLGWSYQVPAGAIVILIVPQPLITIARARRKVKRTAADLEAAREGKVFA